MRVELKLCQSNGDEVLLFEQEFSDAVTGKLAFDVGLYAIHTLINRKLNERVLFKRKLMVRPNSSRRKEKVSA